MSERPMTGRPMTDDRFDSLMADWLQSRADRSDEETVLAAALARTGRARPRPAWSLPERWIPMQLTSRLQPAPRLGPILAVIGLLLVALAIALVAVGSQHRLPPPFGLAGNGTFAWVANGQIVTTDLGSTKPRQVTSGDPMFNRPVFSRDGTKLAYERFTDADQTSGDVIVAAADGSNPKVIDHGVAPIGIIAWSPDGRSVAYMVEAKGPSKYQMRLALTAIDGSSRTVIDSLPGDAWGPVWSPDGKRLLVGVDPGGYTDSYVVDIDGTNARKLNHIRSREGGDSDGEWSPDGSTILYSAGNPDGALGVYLVGLDGATERLISPGVASAKNASYSPDGSQIAYMSNDGGGQGWQVVIADATGKMIKTLPGYHGSNAPTWSPDGSKIAVIDWQGSEETGSAVLVVLDVAGHAAPIRLPGGRLSMGRAEYALTWQRVAQ
jgi:Tol biopolymer transport system component